MPRVLGHTIFRSANSTTYKDIGQFPIDVPEYAPLVPDDTPRRAIWGLDNVYFGNDAVRDLGSAEQFVIGFESSKFSMGYFGLGLGPIALNNGDGRKRNLLNALFAAGVVPSNAVSYTAGSFGSEYNSVVSWKQY